MGPLGAKKVSLQHLHGNSLCLKQLFLVKKMKWNSEDENDASSNLYCF